MPLAERIPFLNMLPEAVRPLFLNLILLALVLVVIWLLRNIVARIIMLPLRNMARKTRTEIDDRALDVIERPTRIFVLGVGVIVVSTVFQIGADLNKFADSIGRALILAAVTFLVYNLIDVIGFNTDTVHRVIGLSIEERLLPFLRTVIKLLIVVMGSLIIIQEFGYDVTGLVASFGVVGLAFSLAAKDTAANVFGFTAIVSDNPFQVGDYIVTGDFAGTIEHVGVRSTRVRKLDQSLVSVPNSKLTDAAVTNWSRLQKRRLDFYIGLTYSTSAGQMRQFLERMRTMLQAREKIDPESVVVRFVEFANSALNIRVIASILLPDWGEYTAEVEEINLAIMGLVEEMGLSMAFPSQSLYIEALPKSNQPHIPIAEQAAASTPAEISPSDLADQSNPTVSDDD